MSFFPKFFSKKELIQSDIVIDETTFLTELNLVSGKLIDENKLPNYQSKKYKIDFSTLFLRDNSTFEKCIYDKNRPIDQNRVNIMFDAFKNVENPHFYEGVCTIGCIRWSKPKILDGQHRISTAMKMSKCDGYLNLISFRTEDEMWDHYIKINKNTPVPEFYKSSETRKKEYVCRICDSIQKKYPKSFKLSRDCNKPFLNIDNFKESLFKIYNKFENQSEIYNQNQNRGENDCDRHISDIYDFNSNISKKSINYFSHCCSNKTASSNAYKKALDGGFFVGMFFNGNDDSVFSTKYMEFLLDKYNPIDLLNETPIDV